ncbi:catechol 2,3-dioxygenase-like lactoylglutathione lyase family enzyme [Bradyrhizobium sp. GM24.11]|jgi:catechol 2,3-dioxygenase-like lactoylglutathione lyase family enzyme
MPVKVEALDHLVINVADVAVTTEWYRRILGMEVKVFDPGGGKAPRTSLQFGHQKINVRPRDADKVEWFTADHQTAGSEDLCFLTSATPSSQGLLAMTEDGARRPLRRFAPRALRWQEDAIIKKQPPSRCRLLEKVAKAELRKMVG